MAILIREIISSIVSNERYEFYTVPEKLDSFPSFIPSRDSANSVVSFMNKRCPRRVLEMKTLDGKSTKRVYYIADQDFQIVGDLMNLTEQEVNKIVINAAHAAWTAGWNAARVRMMEIISVMPWWKRFLKKFDSML